MPMVTVEIDLHDILLLVALRVEAVVKPMKIAQGKMCAVTVRAHQRPKSSCEKALRWTA